MDFGFSLSPSSAVNLDKVDLSLYDRLAELDPGIRTCMGCGSCMWNCPNGAVSFSLTKGVAQKCDACADLRARGYEPACCGACPTRSLKFGDIEELQNEFGVSAAERSFLPIADITDPNLIVKLPANLVKALKEV